MNVGDALSILAEDHFEYGSETQAQLVIAEEAHTFWSAYRHTIRQVWGAIDGLIEERAAIFELRADIEELSEEVVCSKVLREQAIRAKQQAMRHRLVRLQLSQKNKAERCAIWMRYAVGMKLRGIAEGDLHGLEVDAWANREQRGKLTNDQRIERMETMRSMFMEHAPEITGAQILEAIYDGTAILGDGSGSGSQASARLGDDRHDPAGRRSEPLLHG